MRVITEKDLFKLSGISAAIALALGIWVGYAKAPVAGDLRLAREIQAQTRFSETAHFVNWLGDWQWVPFLAVGLIVLWKAGYRGFRGRGPRGPQEALYAFIAIGALRLVNNLLKAVFDSPRPLEELGIRVDRLRDTTGFPSGHVYGDVLFFGALAAFAPLWVPERLVLPVRMLLVAVILLAGPARVYVGAHWPSDALGGYLWGLAALSLGLAYGRWAARQGGGQHQAAAKRARG
ncbi:MAG TPA: phosphatase PAP2 family protein [Tepidiformaceae bacterium]